MNAAAKPRTRCAIYTRKSSDEGLEQEYNSLDAQRDACESYIASQRHEGWVLVHNLYDDGGFSGGNMNRPGLKHLLSDIQGGKIDVVVVYKIDRLTRSLLDFAQLIGLFDKHNVSFVSVTQQFNTTTPMGRLILNILLSFAQFERELTGERIRDKVAASKKKGMWMGGCPPLGYDVADRKLIINPKETKIVQFVFQRFIELRSVTQLERELRLQGITGKTYITQTGRHRYGSPLCKVQIYRILENQIYLGKVHHKGNFYPGQHEAIIDQETWDRVHTSVGESPRTRRHRSVTVETALLKGLVYCGQCNLPMTPVHTLRNGKKYRYYRPSQQLRGGSDECSIGSVAAGELEGIVFAQIRELFAKPDMVVKTWAAAKAYDEKITEKEVRQALRDIDPVWNELFPSEQARIVNLLIERITIKEDGIDVKFRNAGFEGLARDLSASRQPSAAA
ncbi:MAG: recombinase family protein [Alphaproteobacteria bacterium]|nr:recombinase family protein [Alphaproteobacteria bacterium]